MAGRLVALGVILACARATAAPKAEAPAELLATAAVGPMTTLRGLQAYLDAMAPGAGDGLHDRAVRRQIAELVGVSSLDGADPASWMHLLVVSTIDRPVFGLLAQITDAKVLAASAGGQLRVKGSWAVIMSSANAAIVCTVGSADPVRAPTDAICRRASSISSW